MSLRRLTGAAALCGIALVLNGCAVAAIPLVAGGAIVAGKNDKRDEHRVAPPRPAPPAPAEVEEAALSADETDPAQPVPAPTTPSAGAVIAPPQVGTFEAFYTYASEQAMRDPVDQARRSAILASPGSLAPDTTECGILPPAVLVDLDPGDRAVDIGSIAPSHELAQVLAALRAQEVAVFWISRASAGDAGTLRVRLRETGLDPLGHDGLLLMRRPEDRKQLRRRELAQTNCVVAIAGDDKADFDELFAYLKDKDAAAELDPLFGEGWFLTSAAPQSKEN